MRPLQLSFSGIRSYPGKVGPLDFTSKTLIAILGDTGAGKSTILEAITLALYGNCTWTEGSTTRGRSTRRSRRCCSWTSTASRPPSCCRRESSTGC